MKKYELLSAVSKDVGLPPKRIKPVINSFLNHMVMSLLNGDEVMIRGFGTFKMQHYISRRSKNVHTGEWIKTKETDKVRFIQSKSFGIQSFLP